MTLDSVPETGNPCVICREDLASLDENGAERRIFAHDGEGAKHPMHADCLREYSLSEIDKNIRCPTCSAEINVDSLYSQTDRAKLLAKTLSLTARIATAEIAKGALQGVVGGITSFFSVVGMGTGVVMAGVGITAKTAVIAGVGIPGFFALITGSAAALGFVADKPGIGNVGIPAIGKAQAMGLGIGLGVAVIVGAAAGSVTYKIGKVGLCALLNLTQMFWNNLSLAANIPELI